MSYTLVDKVILSVVGQRGNVSAAARKSVLIALANRAGDDGRHAFASASYLAAMAECSIRTVQLCLQTLETDQLIKRNGLRGQAVNWLLDVERIEMLPPVKKASAPGRPRKQAEQELPFPKTPESQKPTQPLRRVSKRKTYAATAGVSEKPTQPLRATYADSAGAPMQPLHTNKSFEQVHEPVEPPKAPQGGQVGEATLPALELKSESADDGFAAAWLLWPQKGRSLKREAQEAWGLQAKTYGAEILKAAVEAYLADPDATREMCAYVPAMQRWLGRRSKKPGAKLKPGLLETWIEIASDRSKGDDDARRKIARNGHDASPARSKHDRMARAELRVAARIAEREAARGGAETDAGRETGDAASGEDADTRH